MQTERKKEIRSLAKVIPELVRSGLVHQALATEKIVAHTFTFSDDFIGALAGVPQNHIESMQEAYMEILNKAYNEGLKSKAVERGIDLTLEKEQVVYDILAKCPLGSGLKNQMSDTFKDRVSKYFETIPDGLQNALLQFGKDLDRAYADGVVDSFSQENFVSVNIEDKIEEKKIDDEKKTEQSETAISPSAIEESRESLEISRKKIGVFDIAAKVMGNVFYTHAPKDIKKIFRLQASEGSHSENAKMLIEFSEWMASKNDPSNYIPDETYKVVASNFNDDFFKTLEKFAETLSRSKTVLKMEAIDKSQEKAEEKSDEAEANPPAGDSMLSKLEAYTKLLKSPESERILRYALGLPPKSALASLNVAARLVGPYDAQTLEAKVLDLMSKHDYSDDNSQTLVVDCLVSNFESMDEISAAKVLAKKLGMETSEEEPVSLDHALRVADYIASQLNVATNLKGQFLFLPVPEGDFCLVYTFSKPKTSEDQKISETEPDDQTVTASKLPEGPQGVLTKNEQSQIEDFMKLGKSKTYKDIKKASPKIATHLLRLINEIKQSKVTLAEGAKNLRISDEDLVYDCFGSDGQKYFNWLKTR